MLLIHTKELKMISKKRFQSAINYTLFFMAVSGGLYASETMAMEDHRGEGTSRASSQPSSSSTERRFPEFQQSASDCLDYDREAQKISSRIIKADSGRSTRLHLKVHGPSLHQMLTSSADFRAYVEQKRGSLLTNLQEVTLEFIGGDGNAMRLPEIPAFISTVSGSPKLKTLFLFGSDNPHGSLLDRDYPDLESLTLPRCDLRTDAALLWRNSLEKTPKLVNFGPDMTDHDISSIIAGDFGDLHLPSLQVFYMIEAQHMDVDRTVAFSRKLGTFAPNIQCLALPILASEDEFGNLAPTLKGIFPELISFSLTRGSRGTTPSSFSQAEFSRLKDTFKQSGIPFFNTFGRDHNHNEDEEELSGEEEYSSEEDL